MAIFEPIDIGMDSESYNNNLWNRRKKKPEPRRNKIVFYTRPNNQVRPRR